MKALLGATLSILACGCAVLPKNVAERYGIVEAHSTGLLKLGRASYLSTQSYVLGETGKKPIFGLAATAQSAKRLPRTISLELYISQALRGKEINSSHLLDRLAKLEFVIPRYTGLEFPADRLVVYLVEPSEYIHERAASLSFNGKHRVAFVVAFDPDHSEDASRSVVRTFAHELLHLTLRLHGARLYRASEERAAISFEYCSELDVFGDVGSPQPIKSIEGGRSAVETSVVTRYARDPSLLKAFAGRARIADTQGSALRGLCSSRIAELLQH